MNNSKHVKLYSLIEAIEICRTLLRITSLIVSRLIVKIRRAGILS